MEKLLDKQQKDVHIHQKNVPHATSLGEFILGVNWVRSVSPSVAAVVVADVGTSSS